MADHWKPNFDGDGESSSTSYFQKTVFLRDWWLVKCPNEFEGKRFGVAGTEESVKSRAMRVFKSSPIIKALDVFTLQASDGIFITLRGYLNKELVIKNGFKPEIAREFIFGFPPCWERICNDCFEEVPSIIDRASSRIVSPCKYSKENLEDNPVESRDVEIYEGEVIDNEVTLPADGCGRKHGADRLGRVTTRSAARVLLTSEQRTDELKVTRVSPHSLSKDSNKTSKPGKQGTSKKSGKILKSDSNHSENIVKSAGKKRKLNASKVRNPTTNDGDHDSQGLNKRYSDTDRVGKLKSNNKPEKKGKSKKSVKNLKSDCNVVTPMNNLGSEANKAKEYVSWEKTKRKIDFDVEVTPDKPKANAASTDSLGQKRSRSGRVLVAPLEFWRNQIPVYDMNRNLIQVKEDQHHSII